MKKQERTAPKEHVAERHDIEPISVRIPAAVRLTGISRTRLYELIKEGELKILKFGSTTVIPLASLRSLIENRQCRDLE